MHDGGDRLDEGYLLKFKLIDAKFMNWEKTLQRCSYPSICRDIH